MIKKILFALGIFGLTGSANALLIDFTSETWSDVSGGTHTETIAGIGEVTLTAFGGSLTFNAADSGGCTAGGGDEAGLACMGDGIGIRDDEITQGGEALAVSFAPAATVIDIILLDLFSSEPEYARITLAGAESMTLGGSTDVGGLVITNIAASGVTSILFQAYGAYSDYALAGIEVAAVPIPGALVLFLSGLAGFGFFRKRLTVTA